MTIWFRPYIAHLSKRLKLDWYFEKYLLTIERERLIMLYYVSPMMVNHLVLWHLLISFAKSYKGISGAQNNLTLHSRIYYWTLLFIKECHWNIELAKCGISMMQYMCLIFNNKISVHIQKMESYCLYINKIHQSLTFHCFIYTIIWSQKMLR